ILLTVLYSLFPYTTLFRSYLPAFHLLGSQEADSAVAIRAADRSTSRVTPTDRGTSTTVAGDMDIPTHTMLRRPTDPEQPRPRLRSEEHTSELQSRFDLVCR